MEKFEAKDRRMIQYCTVPGIVQWDSRGGACKWRVDTYATLSSIGWRANRAKPRETCSFHWRGEGLEMTPQCGDGCRCRYSYCRRIQMRLFRMLLSVVSVAKKFEIQSVGIGSSRRVASS